MTKAHISPPLLKQAVFELITECRQRLTQGQVDVSEVERSVRAYCEAVAALPVDQGRAHTQDLTDLMTMVTTLSDELVLARNAVNAELRALDNLKKANVAYQKSDSIGEKKYTNESDS